MRNADYILRVVLPDGACRMAGSAPLEPGPLELPDRRFESLAIEYSFDEVNCTGAQ
jgi:hypothetical protein